MCFLVTVVRVCVNVETNHFFDRFVEFVDFVKFVECVDLVESASDCIADLSQLLRDALHVHALVPIHKHHRAKYGAVSLQHVVIDRIRHDEMIPRQHENAVIHGHRAPHIRVVAIHFVKIFVQHELTAARVMMQNLGVVFLYHRV